MSVAYLHVDTTALRYNFQQIESIAPGCSILTMIKANAYGHGMVSIAQSLPEADAFGVASLEEGIQLRTSGITQPIVLMQGILDENELNQAIFHQFSLVIHQPEQITMLQHCQPIKPLSIWLKINTGMNRLGLEPSTVQSQYQKLILCPAVKKPIGLMTHLAKADNLSSPATMEQLHLFQTVTRDFTGPRSIANSAGILAWPDTHADWVRPGLMLYGVSPFAETSGKDYHLLPVMTLSSRLIAIQRVKKGECVGYGGTWTATEDTLIGVVGLGYADGYPQLAKNGTPVLINDTLCPLAGRVSMDMITVDLRQQPHCKIGDPVVLWGDRLPVEMVAKHCHTSAYELLCRTTTRARIKIKSFKNE